LSQKLKRDKYLVEDQFKRLLYAARVRPHVNSHRDYALFALSGLCGLRVGEAVAIRVRDCAKLSGSPPIIDVRTLKQRRAVIEEVVVPSTAANALKKFLRRIDRTDPDALVFGISDRQARGLFKHYARLAGLSPAMSFHSLRHFRGVQLYERHKDIQLVKECLRHRRLSSTEVYVHAVNAIRLAADTDVRM
jgi:site-specific recombinase XerD